VAEKPVDRWELLRAVLLQLVEWRQSLTEEEIRALRVRLGESHHVPRGGGD